MSTPPKRDNAPDLSHYWMPFTANRQFKAAPRLFVAAKGMHYTTIDGRQVLDGTAGLWCVNAGHARPEITQAVSRQLDTLDYAPAFQMGHPAAFDLAAAIAAMAPPGLDRVFFTNSGSEAVDTALKLALAYHQVRGEGRRTRLIGRERGYHGVNFGGVSVGGIVNNRRAFIHLPGVDHLRHTHDIKRNSFSRGVPEHGADLADDLEGLVALHGAETIAAVIVEPVACSAGVLIPPRNYLQRLRAICDRHGILLIFDEVITGFGRLGAAFAAQHFNVVPDLITTAKGLTNGAVPMGAVLVKRAIHDAFMAGPPTLIEFFHGYTYSGHPAACAAGLAALDIYRRENLFARAAELAPWWQEAVHSLKGRRHVIDIRNIGLVGAVEVDPRSGAPGARAYDIFLTCFKAGVLVRVTGDVVALSPPLIIEKNQIERLINVLGDALDEAA